MMHGIFLAAIAGLMVTWLGWGFRTLPREKWQILATVPAGRDGAGKWRGVNLTYYGLLSASAYLFGVMLFVILAGSIGTGRLEILAILGILFALCVPASSLIAKYVEGKPYGFTVGGACFLGIVAGPWQLLGLRFAFEQWSGLSLEIWPLMAALAVAYVAGEGLGRTACISFGCCYGKPLSDVSPLGRRVFERFHFVFQGATKKISYASGLEGAKVVPIQAITATVLAAVTLVGILLFLSSHFIASYLIAVVVSQLWRAYSETLRADWRGGGRISAYQVMAGLGAVYALGVAWLFDHGPAVAADVARGLDTLWDPLMILVLQLVWVVIFLFMGRSMVTGASLSFHVHRERL